MLGNYSSIAVPRAHRKLSTYFGPPSADSIRDSGETAKEKWLNAEIKALQSLALGGSAGQSRANASNTCKAPSFSRKVTWITEKLGTI